MVINEISTNIRKTFHNIFKFYFNINKLDGKFKMLPNGIAISSLKNRATLRCFGSIRRIN